MITETKQLEGLGKLLKAAGVKPAGTEQMVREHLHDMQQEATQHHAEMVNMVRTVKDELIELRHNHSLALAEIRIATDLMRREVEASSMSIMRTLRLAKAGMVLLMLMQLGIFAILVSTNSRDLTPNPTASEAAAEPASTIMLTSPVPAPVK